MTSSIWEEIIAELGITKKKLKLYLKTLIGEKSEQLVEVDGLIVSGISCGKERTFNGLLPTMEGLDDFFPSFLKRG